MPQHLDQPAAAPTEHEQMPTVRITLECLLYQQGQTIKALAHVGVAGRQPNSCAAGICAGSQSCRRPRNTWLAAIPAARAPAEATAPGSIAAATIRSFSARDHRRRRSTDVITSTCALVIGLALGVALGLNEITHLHKAALAGCVRPW